MKRSFCIVLIAIMIFAAAPISHANNSDVSIYFKGEPVYCDVPPVIESGRTLVPLRAIVEVNNSLKIEWDADTDTVIISSTIDNAALCTELQIGSKIARSYFTITEDGSDQFEESVALYYYTRTRLDVPPKIINGRTMVPLRFISEELEYNVQGDGDRRVVFLDTVITDDLLASIDAARLENNVQEMIITISHIMGSDVGLEIYFGYNGKDYSTRLDETRGTLTTGYRNGRYVVLYNDQIIIEDKTYKVKLLGPDGDGWYDIISIIPY